mmetsp:Transcript_108163/g.262854  ORF Transcript_108163/g.262854 Transcript_108163/m.262854 type:complete len:290 (-) Transcript_108163:594-1463(-)
MRPPRGMTATASPSSPGRTPRLRLNPSRATETTTTGARTPTPPPPPPRTSPTTTSTRRADRRRRTRSSSPRRPSSARRRSGFTRTSATSPTSGPRRRSCTISSATPRTARTEQPTRASTPSPTTPWTSSLGASQSRRRWSLPTTSTRRRRTGRGARWRPGPPPRTCPSRTWPCPKRTEPGTTSRDPTPRAVTTRRGTPRDPPRRTFLRMIPLLRSRRRKPRDPPRRITRRDPSRRPRWRPRTITGRPSPPAPSRARRRLSSPRMTTSSPSPLLTFPLLTSSPSPPARNP